MKLSNVNCYINIAMLLDCTTADIVLLLDSSGSIGIDNWYKVLNFTQEIVNSFTIGPDNVRVGVIWYGNRASIAFHMNTYDNEAEVLQAIGSIRYKDQNTNTSGALRTMHESMFTEVNGDRVAAQNIGILISDGAANRDEDLTIPEANAARAAGITLFAIGIGDAIDPEELRGIANEPSEQFTFEATGFDTLEHIKDIVYQAACTFAAQCTQDADFTFIMDASRSVGSTKFELVKQFVTDLVYELNVDNGLSRVGVMTYSSEPTLHAVLDQYETREDVANMVQQLKYEGGKTETSLVLKMAREQMYSTGNGDRPDINNVIVLITNGGSSNFDATLEEAVLAKLAGITIIVVSVSNWYNEFEIKQIASDPDTHNVFALSTMDDYVELITPSL